MKRKWTEDEIWAWYKEQPWISGFNFIPSGAMDGAVWLLQEYDHENAFRDAAKEISAASLPKRKPSVSCVSRSQIPRFTM